MPYNYFKALHIIGFVTWFAGLFYLVRLFVYHVEAQGKPEPEGSVLRSQFVIMEQRLFYIITWPGMVITLIFGTAMLVWNPALLSSGWLHTKLFLLVLLIIYHFMCGNMMRNLKTGTHSLTSGKLRMWNEVATLLLVGIVFLAVLKNTANSLYGILGFAGVAVLLFLGIRIYKAYRNRN